MVLLSKGAGTNPNRIEERRPISILNTIYKIVASVLDKWLQTHMRAHPTQFGFQKNVSTWGATTRMKLMMRRMQVEEEDGLCL